MVYYPEKDFLNLATEIVSLYVDCATSDCKGSNNLKNAFHVENQDGREKVLA